MDGHTALSYARFLFVSAGSVTFASLFPKTRLPIPACSWRRTVFGIIIGPQVLGAIPPNGLPQQLRYITWAALVFIGLTAGAELKLMELRPIKRQILWTTSVITVFTVAVIAPIVQTLARRGMLHSTLDEKPDSCLWSLSFLVSAVMVARSPATAISIMKELKAKGPLTSSMLGITIVSDVVVLVLFTFLMEGARASCVAGRSFSAMTIGQLSVSFLLTVVLGLGMGLLFRLLLSHRIRRYCAHWFIVPAGFFFYAAAEAIQEASEARLALIVEIEPLLAYIIAGAYISNRTPYTQEFESHISSLSIWAFVPFFTLAGANLNLSILGTSYIFAIVVVLARTAAVFFGSFLGSYLSNAPENHRYLLWLSLITQSGVSIGLASKIALSLKETGEAVSTTLLAVIMINQLVGPLVQRPALVKAREHNRGRGHRSDGFSAPVQPATLVNGMHMRASAVPAAAAVNGGQDSGSDHDQERQSGRLRMQAAPEGTQNSLKSVHLEQVQLQVPAGNARKSLQLVRRAGHAYGVDVGQAQVDISAGAVSGSLAIADVLDGQSRSRPRSPSNSRSGLGVQRSTLQTSTVSSRSIDHAVRPSNSNGDTRPLLMDGDDHDELDLERDIDVAVHVQTTHPRSEVALQVPVIDIDFELGMEDIGDGSGVVLAERSVRYGPRGTEL